ncbi:uncharacterized protein MONBRDRAFT_15407 [Monosiga brevicollis MX1]|uniref:Mitochondrial carrier protein n=1 Tax=Monosiga brevicollis TaxID=81824 RepID=A9UT93_MONBE|nr:uncharacterized protein MONBRDRAFT_15407 [Monosiga brevicollis MX1]EDQ91453.1 predicted protein [Monosiga brevicollis MX1]|eukprot:XP_001743875.1 hypothetical protein [Monosiga brevicollis MX1]
MAVKVTAQGVDLTKYPLSGGENLLCSLAASCVAEAVTYPFEVAKVRLQIQGSRALLPVKFTGMFDSMIKVGRNEGLMALMAGLPSGLLRHSIAGTMRLGLYDPTISYLNYGTFEKPTDPSELKEVQLWQRMLASSSTGAVAMVFANPADLVKTKLQASIKPAPGQKVPFKGTVSCFKYIMATEGVAGLFHGLKIAVPRMAWQNMAEVTAYDLTKDLLRKHYGMEDGLPLFFLGSLSAGFFGAYLGNPLDCIKTRIYRNELGPDGKPLYSGPIDALTKMIRNEGVLSLWKGVVPLWIHVSAFSVAVFVTFDMLRLQVRKSKARQDGHDI